VLPLYVRIRQYLCPSKINPHPCNQTKHLESQDTVLPDRLETQKKRIGSQIVAAMALPPQNIFKSIMNNLRQTLAQRNEDNQKEAEGLSRMFLNLGMGHQRSNSRQDGTFFRRGPAYPKPLSNMAHNARKQQPSAHSKHHVD
jgi:hypothetical protein